MVIVTQSGATSTRAVYSRSHKPQQTASSHRSHRPERKVPTVAYVQPPVPKLPTTLSNDERGMISGQSSRSSSNSPAASRGRHEEPRPGVPSTEGFTEETIDELAALDRAIQEAQARQIGSKKTREEEAKEQRNEQIADCCYDCCCFSLV